MQPPSFALDPLLAWVCAESRCGYQRSVPRHLGTGQGVQMTCRMSTLFLDEEDALTLAGTGRIFPASFMGPGAWLCDCVVLINLFVRAAGRGLLGQYAGLLVRALMTIGRTSSS